jgi:UDP-N-acetyl-D-glucosamine/UDP-N-acetyl-D-galactosamine dehydrogenase
VYLGIDNMSIQGQYKNSKIAIVEMGYFGLPLAIEFGKKHNVVGYDINVDRIKELKECFDATGEITFEEFKNSENLTFSSPSLDIMNAEFI